MPVDVVTGDRDLFQLVDDEAEVRVLYIARGVGNHERVTDDGRAREVRRRCPASTPTSRRCAATPPTGCPGVAGVGEKTAATLLQRFGDLAGIIAAAEDPDSDMAPGPRRKILDAADYLEVAPTVVAVARDIDLGAPDLTLPLTPVDPNALVALSEQWGLESPSPGWSRR